MSCKPLSPSAGRVGCWLALAAFAGLAVGCSGSNSNLTMPDDRAHILRAASLATKFRNANNRFPNSAEELKAWARKSLKPEQLKEMQIDDLDKAMTSPRDGQPYLIAKPGNDPMAKRGMMSILVYEKEGVNGKHLTASSMGSTNEAAREAMQAQLPDFGK